MTPTTSSATGTSSSPRASGATASTARACRSSRPSASAPRTSARSGMRSTSSPSARRSSARRSNVRRHRRARVHARLHGTTPRTSSTSTSRVRSTSRCPTSSVSGSIMTNGSRRRHPREPLARGRRQRSAIRISCRHMADPPASPFTVSRPDDQPALLGHRHRQRRRPHQQRRRQQGRLPDHRRRHLQRADGLRASAIDKAAPIYYRVQTAYLTSASDYADLGTALPQACTDLIGTEGITAADCGEVADAVAATEMATEPPNASDSAGAGVHHRNALRRLLRRPREHRQRELGARGRGRTRRLVLPGGPRTRSASSRRVRDERRGELLGRRSGRDLRLVDRDGATRFRFRPAHTCDSLMRSRSRTSAPPMTAA